MRIINYDYLMWKLFELLFYRNVFIEVLLYRNVFIHKCTYLELLYGDKVKYLALISRLTGHPIEDGRLQGDE